MLTLPALALQHITKKGIIMKQVNTNTIIEELKSQPLNRIADALEEILRLVKQDQEKMQRYKEETTERWDREEN